MSIAEDNEVLTRVGRGTPMGELFRRFWIPALLSEELPGPDCAPVRVKLLNEDLVAFRDSNGKIGLLGEYCSHRRASLFYGRVGECGLTCIYHGWKYDVDGKVMDIPAEPETSNLKDDIRHTSYPCEERNGIVLTYMGPKEKTPLVPNLPWFTMPRDHVVVGSKLFLECNWLQALEGDNDSIHSAYLHRRISGEGTPHGPGTPAPRPRHDRQAAVGRACRDHLSVRRRSGDGAHQHLPHAVHRQHAAG